MYNGICRQECIPYRQLIDHMPGGGVLLAWGVSLVGGVLPARGGFSLPGGVLPARRGVLPAGWRGLLAGGGGFSLPGGVLPAGQGASLPRGSPCPGGLLTRGGSPCWEGFSLLGGPYQGGSPCCGGGGFSLSEIPPPVDRITDMSKNITLATTSLRPVKIPLPLEMVYLGISWFQGLKWYMSFEKHLLK